MCTQLRRPRFRLVFRERKGTKVEDLYETISVVGKGSGACRYVSLTSPLDEPRTSSEAACALRNVCAAEPLSQDAGIVGPERRVSKRVEMCASLSYLGTSLPFLKRTEGVVQPNVAFVEEFQKQQQSAFKLVVFSPQMPPCTPLFSVVLTCRRPPLLSARSGDDFEGETPPNRCGVRPQDYPA